MKQFCKLLVAFIIVLGSSCSNEDDAAPAKNENLPEPQVGAGPPSNSSAISMGTFASFAHGLSGEAVLYTDPQGNRTLRFETFTMTAGPDVYVLFSKTNNYSAANTVAISMLKEGYANADLNFNIPSDINIEAHKFILVYCIQYSSLFGYSELKQ
jgi:hypothetical protein